MLGSDEPEKLAARLAWMFVDQRSDASDAQLQSVRRWQGRDKFYREVQKAAEDDPEASDEARNVADDLASLAAPVTQRMVVWRGIRSVHATFGLSATDLHTVVGQILEVSRFFATTVDRRIAEGEFTEPAPDPALYRVTVEAGTEAVWVPPLGYPEDAYQNELLLLPGLEARIVAVDTSGIQPIVEVEVSDG